MLALVETARERLADELFQRDRGLRENEASFGRVVDEMVIWFLFVRMCGQHKVAPPNTEYWQVAGSECQFLSEILAKSWEEEAPHFSSPLPAESLGSIYEAFLRKPIALTRSGPRFDITPTLRKNGGVYYTPQYIVDYIVEETVGRMLAEKPREIGDLRVLDPACGAGRFLLRVYERLVQEHGTKQVSQREILSNCIFGIDIDELAVEVTKLSLYLKLLENGPASTVQDQRDSMGILAANIRCGNSLLSSPSGTFDVVLGNPPYGAKLTPVMRTCLAKKYDAGTTETAALMMLQASRSLTRPGGRNGFIVPKAFSYSSNWRKVRGELLDEMTSLVDVGKAWPEVRLEQVIYFLHKGAPSESYTNLKRHGERFDDVAWMDKQHCQRFGFLLNGIAREELEVGLKIQNAGSFLGEHVSNTRGAMLQDQVTSVRGGVRVIGGKQVQRYRIFGEKGFISSKRLDKNAFVAPDSILVQNIIAHIESPIDHIKITAAIVDQELAGEVVILDTINQLTNRSALSPYFFLAILNSQMMSWYVYRFIYAKAIRTMHFDGPVTSRIPLPRIAPRNQHLYEEIVRVAKALSEKQCREISQAIENTIHRLYGLSASEASVIESGMPSSTRTF